MIQREIREEARSGISLFGRSVARSSFVEEKKKKLKRSFFFSLNLFSSRLASSPRRQTAFLAIKNDGLCSHNVYWPLEGSAAAGNVDSLLDINNNNVSVVFCFFFIFQP